jgi:2,3-bisphosphoglycerate-independent phosphoglycerate mutase
MAKKEGVTRAFVHCFTDGRDKPPESGVEYVRELVRKIQQIGVGKIATISGRYYAMDRDKRWERIDKAFRALVAGEGEKAHDPVEAIQGSYAKGVTDEFIVPTVMTTREGAPVGRIENGDAVIFFNFRADRARQISRALNDPGLEQPPRSLMPQDLLFVTLTEYDRTLEFPHVLEPQTPTAILGEIVSAEGWRNLRTAETEKYPHVTYFFNGGREQPFAGEERELIASPKVATYDLQPEMSAYGVCDVVVKGIESGDFDLIVVNFANGDMVGHTGKLDAAIKAIETVDECLGRIDAPLRKKGGAWIITADHGNADLMVDPATGQPHTYHTTFPVPLILASEFRGSLKEGGSLRDIAPTILSVMGLEKPREMTGRDLREIS